MMVIITYLQFLKNTLGIKSGLRFELKPLRKLCLRLLFMNFQNWNLDE